MSDSIIVNVNPSSTDLVVINANPNTTNQSVNVNDGITTSIVNVSSVSPPNVSIIPTDLNIDETININQGGFIFSVNGKIGHVIITKDDIGLDQVDNTSDLNKPLSLAQIQALALKANQSDLSLVSAAQDAFYVDASRKINKFIPAAFIVETNSSRWIQTSNIVLPNYINWNEAFTNISQNSSFYLGLPTASVATWDSVYATTRSSSAFWQQAYTNLLANSSSYIAGGNLVNVVTGYLPLSGGFLTGNITTSAILSSSNIIYALGGDSDLWNSVYNFINSTSANEEDQNEVVNFVLANSSNILQVNTKVNTTSASWDSVYSTYNTNSSLYATKQYTDNNFLALSGGYITGDISIGGNLYLLGSATQISTEDIVLTNSLFYLASGNPSDIVDIGFVGYTSSLNLGQSYVGLIRDAFTKKWVLFSNLSAISGSDINIDNPSLKVDTLRANIEGNLVTNTNVFGNLSATGNVYGDNLKISFWNDAFDKTTFLSNNSSKYILLSSVDTQLNINSTNVVQNSAVAKKIQDIENSLNILVDPPTYIQPSATLTSLTTQVEIGTTVNQNITLNWTQGNAGAAQYFRLLRNNVQVQQQSASWIYNVSEAATANTTTFTNVVSYAQGPILNNALGLPDARGRIATGSKSTNSSFTGYYRIFYGAVDVLPTNLRNLPKNNHFVTTNAGTTVTMNAGEFGTIDKNIIAIAMPSNRNLSEVITNANETITNNFTVSSVFIPDAAGTPVSYKLYRNTTIVPLNIPLLSVKYI